MIRVFLSYEFNDENRYYIPLIKETLKSHGGVQVYEASSLMGGSDFISTLHDSINKCDLLIAFMSGDSRNVVYEIGYAMGKGKEVMIITDNYRKIPFDLKAVRTFSFSNNSLAPYEIMRFIDTVENKRDKFNDTEAKDLEQLLQDYIEKPDEFDQISSQEFENMLFDWLILRGYKLSKVDKEDIGYDFIISNYCEFNKTLVEIKKYNINSKVSVGMLQQFLGVLYYYKADHGIFISSSGYTKSAIDFSEYANPKIELWDMESIKENYKRLLL